MVTELKKQRELQKELMEKCHTIFNEYGAESALLKPIQVRLDGSTYVPNIPDDEIFNPYDRGGY